MIEVEKIGSFNPFNHKAFFCPVCGSNEFYDLYPYGGVWCARCNAEFRCSSTCDGPRKLAIHVNVKNVWWDGVPEESKIFRSAIHFWTVMWESDDKVSWMMRYADNQLATITKEEDGSLRAIKF